jgi:hypothetical protein
VLDPLARIIRVREHREVEAVRARRVRVHHRVVAEHDLGERAIVSHDVEHDLERLAGDRVVRAVAGLRELVVGQRLVPERGGEGLLVDRLHGVLVEQERVGVEAIVHHLAQAHVEPILVHQRVEHGVERVDALALHERDLLGRRQPRGQEQGGLAQRVDLVELLDVGEERGEVARVVADGGCAEALQHLLDRRVLLTARLDDHAALVIGEAARFGQEQRQRGVVLEAHLERDEVLHRLLVDLEIPRPVLRLQHERGVGGLARLVVTREALLLEDRGPHPLLEEFRRVHARGERIVVRGAIVVLLATVPSLRLVVVGLRAAAIAARERGRQAQNAQERHGTAKT